MRLIYTVLILGMMVGCGQDADIISSSVMITDMSERSGGSGVIISSSDTTSKVLTNRHVCEVVAHGGLIHTVRGTKHYVSSYKQSEVHDLCVISVSENLNAYSEISDRMPWIFEKAKVVGYPALQPLTISEGNFSSRSRISVLIGVRACTDAERNDPSISVFCFLAGGMPIIKTYDAIYTGALIRPGSSGSPVYTSDNKIGALIFAGEGPLGYGWGVPLEYIISFLGMEVKNIDPKFPDSILDLSGFRSAKNRWRKAARVICETTEDEKQEQVCTSLEELLRGKL